MQKRKNLGFRAWFYFRMGWSTYFAFILAAINVMVTTYYLAIKDVPTLKIIFPSFLSYVGILLAIGIPLLTVVGYVHFKRTSAFKAEADIGFEVNPHFRRMLINTEKILHQHLKISKMLVKISKNEKLTEEDLKEIDDMQNELNEYTKRRTIEDKDINS
jgi:hypothetical protein